MRLLLFLLTLLFSHALFGDSLYSNFTNNSDFLSINNNCDTIIPEEENDSISYDDSTSYEEENTIEAKPYHILEKELIEITKTVDGMYDIISKLWEVRKAEKETMKKIEIEYNEAKTQYEKDEMPPNVWRRIKDKYENASIKKKLADEKYTKYNKQIEILEVEKAKIREAKLRAADNLSGNRN